MIVESGTIPTALFRQIERRIRFLYELVEGFSVGIAENASDTYCVFEVRIFLLENLTLN